MRVLKFGGTSVGSPDAIRRVAQIVRQSREDHGAIVVVVSAFQGVTDALIDTARRASKGDEYQTQFHALEERHTAVAHELISTGENAAVATELGARMNEMSDLLRGVALTHELSPRLQDAIMSFGERLSAYIIAAYFRASEIDAAFLDMRELVRTDAQFGSARVDRAITYPAIHQHFEDGHDVQVATGFIGATSADETTTLGRGGSDYTASLLGAALNADEIEIWTDVDGVLTADPRKVPEAFVLDALTYEEAMELAHFGAKVIYPPTIQPALVQGIPLRIKNTFKPESPGTIISGKRAPSAHAITSLTSISSVALLLVQGSGMIGAAGTAMRLFGALARRHVSAILITQASSEHTICVGIDPTLVQSAIAGIEEEFALEMRAGEIEPVGVKANCSVVTIVGEGMRERPGIAEALFSALGERRVNVIAIAQGSSELNISVVVDQRDEVASLRAIHEAFFAPMRRHLNLFLAGTGLIGSTLLRLIDAQSLRLRTKRDIHLHLCGLANSQLAYISDASNIDPTQATDLLADDEQHIDSANFVQAIAEMRLPNSVLIDCTASEAVPMQYAAAIKAGIAVVTANKRGLTLARERHEVLQGAQMVKRTPLLYETTVGAALPIIATLRDLIATGDQNIALEGVLSGTLSYLFNTFDGTKPFSDVLRSAQQAGFTEPDPRDDLGGADVARKLLILARECGYNLNMEDIAVEQFLPHRCLEAPSVEAFYTALADEDAHFEQLRAEAERNNTVLRYVARMKDGKCSVALEPVSAAHPLAHLAGAENCIAITSERYKAVPLVIRGPGAGAEVTAAGVLADILRVADLAR